MVKVTAKEYAEKWIRRLKSAREDIERGVKKLTENPCEKAIAKKDKLIKRLMEAFESGKWDDALASVTRDEWRKMFLDKGLRRIGEGAEKAQGKVEDIASALLEFEEKLQEEIKRMPDLTLDDNVARAEKVEIRLR